MTLNKTPSSIQILFINSGFPKTHKLPKFNLTQTSLASTQTNPKPKPNPNPNPNPKPQTQPKHLSH